MLCPRSRCKAFRKIRFEPKDVVAEAEEKVAFEPRVIVVEAVRFCLSHLTEKNEIHKRLSCKSVTSEIIVE